VTLLDSSEDPHASSKRKIDPLLVKAAGDVRHIVSHLARNGKTLDDGDCRSALELVEHLESGKPFSPDQESQFWKVFAILVKEALPARVEALYYEDWVDSSSIQDGTNPEILRIKKREDMLRRVRKISIIAFSITLSILAYLSLTESIIQRNGVLDAEYLKLSAGITKGTRLEYLDVSSTNSGSKNLEKPAATGSGGATPSTRDARQEAIIAATMAQIASLITFNDTTLKVLQLGLGSLKAADGLTPLDGSVLAMQQSINGLLSKYFLAVAAALLGVTVFILRSASANIQALSFKWHDFGIYSNRLALGVIGGIAISWFSVTDTTGIVGSITPAALAFLVGYSVEVLYNVLDSLVKALGGVEKG